MWLSIIGTILVLFWSCLVFCFAYKAGVGAEAEDAARTAEELQEQCWSKIQRLCRPSRN